MIIWSGFGFVVAAIGAAAVAFTEWIRTDPLFHQGYAWLAPMTMSIAAAFTYCLYQVLGLQTARIARDRNGWRRLILPSGHTLLFVSIKWWPAIFLTSGVLTLLCAPALTVNAEPLKRPVRIHHVAELGLEIWTEAVPEWDTRLERRNGQHVFVAETPALSYPPAGLSWASVEDIRFDASEIEAGARGAIHQVARSHGVSAIERLEVKAARYGELVGYESVFSGTVQGMAIDVRVFCGHQPGQRAVVMQALTLAGKLDHIREQVRRSWSNVRYLR